MSFQKQAHLEVLSTMPVGRLLRAASRGEDVQYEGPQPPQTAIDKTLMLIAEIVAHNSVLEIPTPGVAKTYAVGLTGVSNEQIDHICKATDTPEQSIHIVDIFEENFLIRRCVFGMERPIAYTA